MKKKFFVKCPFCDSEVEETYELEEGKPNVVNWECPVCEKPQTVTITPKKESKVKSIRNLTRLGRTNT